MPRSIARVSSGGAAKGGERREIDVLQSALDRIETLGLLVGKDVDHRTAGDEPGRDHLEALLIIVQLLVADDLAPDLPAGGGNEVGRLAFELDAPVGEYRHARTEVGHVVDDVGRQDDDDIVADRGEKVEEAVALFRVETSGRLVDDDQ